MKPRRAKDTPQERVARTIKTVARSIPESLRPYLVYRGEMPKPRDFTAAWYPAELVIETPGKAPRRVTVDTDNYGILYGLIESEAAK
jgi:hypothetical protein